jgi:hypothetical protein
MTPGASRSTACTRGAPRRRRRADTAANLTGSRASALLPPGGICRPGAGVRRPTPRLRQAKNRAHELLPAQRLWLLPGVNARTENTMETRILGSVSLVALSCLTTLAGCQPGLRPTPSSVVLRTEDGRTVASFGPDGKVQVTRPSDGSMETVTPGWFPQAARYDCDGLRRLAVHYGFASLQVRCLELHCNYMNCKEYGNCVDGNVDDIKRNTNLTCSGWLPALAGFFRGLETAATMCRARRSSA